jgi:hypothetical protein
VAFRPIHGFATAISKTFFWQSQLTLTPPRGRDFPRLNREIKSHKKIKKHVEDLKATLAMSQE